MNNRAPLIVAIALSFLPMLYVASYFAMVVPEGKTHVNAPGMVCPVHISYYRIGYRVPEIIFWPIEQIDRNLRPIAWEVGDLSHYGSGPTSLEP